MFLRKVPWHQRLLESTVVKSFIFFLREYDLNFTESISNEPVMQFREYAENMGNKLNIR